MKKTVGIFLAATLCLTGCAPGEHPFAGELSRAALVRAVGLDAVERGVLFSAAPDEEGGGERGALSALGGSVAQAAERVRSLGNSEVYLGHVDQILISRNFAESGLPGLLDFLSRDRQIGPGVRLWVLREGAAEEVLLTAQAASRMERLETEGIAVDGTAARLMSVLAEDGSLCLPALRYMPGTENGRPGTLLPEGCAVIRAGHMVGFLDEMQAEGLTLLTNCGAGQVTVLTLPDGTAASLRLADGVVHCAPVFAGKTLVAARIDCVAQAELIQSQRLLTAAQQTQLERELAGVLRQKMESTLGCAQFWDADFVGLEQRLRRSCPWRARQIETQWPERFRTLSLQVEVRVTLERTADME